MLNDGHVLDDGDVFDDGYMDFFHDWDVFHMMMVNVVDVVWNMNHFVVSEIERKSLLKLDLRTYEGVSH